MYNKLLSVIVCILLLFSCSDESMQHRSALLQYDREIDGILEQMPLEEKINMLHGKYMFTSVVWSVWY
jgi:beta-glucosidase